MTFKFTRHSVRGLQGLIRKIAIIAVFPVLLASCTTGDVFKLEPAVDVRTTSASIRPAPVVPAQLSSPPMTVGYVPRVEFPEAPRAVMPADEVDCRRQLSRMGAKWRDIPSISGHGACGIAWPVELEGTGGGISVQPSAKLTCRMALAFTKWTRNELAPAARLRYLTGIRTIRQGSSYSCRNIAGSSRLSAHGKGNAIDVMAITLKSGREIDVHKPGFFSFREKAFLRNVRSDACPYFTTVLGPGYNRDHRDHFHFDLMHRKSGHRTCK